MNLEHFCTSLSALFDMYSLNMSKVTNQPDFILGLVVSFQKYVQIRQKYTTFAYIFGQNVLSKWHKNDLKLVKDSCILHNFFNF